MVIQTHLCQLNRMKIDKFLYNCNHNFIFLTLSINSDIMSLFVKTISVSYSNIFNNMPQL